MVSTRARCLVSFCLYCTCYPLVISSAVMDYIFTATLMIPKYTSPQKTITPSTVSTLMNFLSEIKS